jgi:Fe-S cluster assembly ATPase SufC
MQLRNNREFSNVQFNAYVNKGEAVSYRDPLTGATLSKAAKPVYKLIHVPPLATVEIEDELWAAVAEDCFCTIKVQEEIREEIDVLSLGKDKKATRSVLMPTGETKRVNLIDEMIKEGRITIVVEPKSKLTLDEKKALVTDAGIKLPKDSDEEYVNKMWLLVK